MRVAHTVEDLIGSTPLVDLSSLADGIYIVSVASDNGRKVMKVVVD